MESAFRLDSYQASKRKKTATRDLMLLAAYWVIVARGERPTLRKMTDTLKTCYRVAFSQPEISAWLKTNRDQENVQ